MTPIQLPKQGEDIRDLWKPVARCARAINAIAKMKGQGVSFTLHEDNADLKVEGTGAVSTSGGGGNLYLQIISNGVLAYINLPAGASVVAGVPEDGIVI